jgi:REP element-mobilizing transposase RayT
LLRQPQVARIVQEALLHSHGNRYHLHAWVVMPNHVHILFTPARYTAISDIMQAWKSSAAKKINQVLGRSGTVWQPDYFDRMIRDERHFRAAMTYIENNPVRAGICTQASQWPWSSAAKDWATHQGTASVFPDQSQASTGGAGVSSTPEQRLRTSFNQGPQTTINERKTSAGSAGVSPASLVRPVAAVPDSGASLHQGQNVAASGRLVEPVRSGGGPDARAPSEHAAEAAGARGEREMAPFIDGGGRDPQADTPRAPSAGQDMPATNEGRG